jgi:hypothetical protein
MAGSTTRVAAHAPRAGGAGPHGRRAAGGGDPRVGARGVERGVRLPQRRLRLWRAGCCSRATTAGTSLLKVFKELDCC